MEHTSDGERGSPVRLSTSRHPPGAGAFSVQIWTLVAAAVLLAACTPPEAPEQASPLPPADERGEPPPAAAGELQNPPDFGSDFDRETQRAEAEALIGRSEAEVAPDRNLRIVRRGEEQFPVTMDLRPGRRNVELDQEPSGRWVVTRVVVEAPPGQDSIVAE